jgi:hypothetical protein
MGRKGTSKRKTSKSKNPTPSSGGGTGAVSNIARVSDAPVAQPHGKGETVSGGKKTKKK